MVELTGIEPATSGVQNRRSPNLSYSPKNWSRFHPDAQPKSSGLFSGGPKWI
jgi:hypothetical protein